MTGPTVIYLLSCAAMPRGCASALAIDGPPGIELLALDLQVPEDKRVHGLITAAGWRLDHGKWVCGNHPFATPAGPVTALYWPTVPTPEQAEVAKRAVLETAAELLNEPAHERALADLRTAANILTGALDAENVTPELASRILNRFLFGDPRGLDAGSMPHPETSHDD